MIDDNDFELWLGRVGHDKSIRAELLLRRNRAGVGKSSSKRRFTGERIGRGGPVAALLSSSDRYARSDARRVIVKTRIVRIGAKGIGGARAHLRYLQRDGTTRAGERGELYGRDTDVADGKSFLARCDGDRHQFRVIVSPEDGDQYEDLKSVVRRLMSQAEADLKTSLDWVAVDHFNTGHPHSHIMIRGVDDRGQNLVITPAYIAQGLRERAMEIVNNDLGPRTRLEMERSDRREIDQHRLTGIDRRILASAEHGIARAVHSDPHEQSLRAGRLQTLGKLGLATEIGQGSWKLDDWLEEKLRRMGERGDIIITMQRMLRQELPDRPAIDQAIFDPKDGQTIVGRVVTRGLSDEHADRHYLIVDAVDGRSHYVDIGEHDEPIATGAIVSITPARAIARKVDQTVDAIAKANGGRYSAELHALHDGTASQRFIQAHVRRLEAMRKLARSVEREPDGSWTIAPDHLERATAYEREQNQKHPVIIDTLAERGLKDLARHDGATWLDHELISAKPVRLERGFGAEVRKAQDVRRQWLIEQQLAEVDGDRTLYASNLVAVLQQRELRRVAAQLGEELGLNFIEVRTGEKIEGRLTRSVTIGDGKFALVEKSKEFTLVPWRPVLEKAVGKEITGIVKPSGIDWTIGRSRGIDMGM